MSIVSTLAVFTVCEIGSRFYPLSTDEAPQRYLMWSSPTFEVDPHGAVTLAKNARIRDVAVYDGKIEYDMFYQTNDFGSPDTVNYGEAGGQNTGGRRVAFVGDSFAAGQGGHDWFSKLRGSLQASKSSSLIYNFSLPGASVSHFEKTLRSVSEKLEFTDIVLCAISDDFLRTYWKPVERNGIIYFCTDPEMKGDASSEVATVIGKDASELEILDHVKAVEVRHQQEAGERQQRMSRGQTAWSGAGRLLKRSRFLHWVDGRRRIFIHQQKEREKEIDLAPLMSIKALFPNARIALFHLPQKDEVISGRYDRELQKRVEFLGMTYIPALHKYHWDRSMFHVKDSHPNDAGYDKISEVVKEWLIELDKTTTLSTV